MRFSAVLMVDTGSNSETWFVPYHRLTHAAPFHCSSWLYVYTHALSSAQHNDWHGNMIFLINVHKGLAVLWFHYKCFCYLDTIKNKILCGRESSQNIFQRLTYSICSLQGCTEISGWMSPVQSCTSSFFTSFITGRAEVSLKVPIQGGDLPQRHKHWQNA